MKTKLKLLLLLSFFALSLMTSCQDEVVDITTAEESEAIAANSELAVLIEATSTKDGSMDNIIDRASCLTVGLPITVSVHGLEIKIDSTEDYKIIAALFKEFDYDYSDLEIFFPITVTTSNFTEITIESKAALIELAQECRGENEDDDDIECIDFQYPISFSVYDTRFQAIDVVTIESDRAMYRFIHRVREGEVFASLNFPVTMVLGDGTTIEVNNNLALRNAMREAKNACDEDDDNDYGDTDFTKERLDNLLQTCPWVVYEFERNEDDLRDKYREYAVVFKAENIVQVRTRGGDTLTGTWSTRVTDNGALIKLEFDTLVDFSLEWFVYDLEYGRIKLYQAGGNRVILKKNCDIVFDYTKESIENYLQECYWRVERLNVEGVDNENEYIGTPLKFYTENLVKLRINGELVEGTYLVTAVDTGFMLQIAFEGRPNLNLEWLITFLEPGLIKLENDSNKMVLKRHCPELDGDLKYIDALLIVGDWEVAKYQDGDVDKTSDYSNFTLNFMVSGRVTATDLEANVINGSWLAYRYEGVFLGMHFEETEPFTVLNHRWRVKEVSTTRIELKDLSASGAVERILVLEKRN
ncbi:hypothetical protein [Aestuariibaculum lutulentum]|uniref:Lipocalin-like domain-containing protein n=1 Tax=Aestuariibaculum lutulentum TaxID=2920935 RepID=A0ABS9RMC2_9FLAO|nr:hypothetical protein [Aestuariibaculum lutulentum]MCH4553706.1 hypothetical protein [Aestuariibaculum lutulentum]